MRKLFTFLVAFLATVSGTVWGQTYGSEQSDPIVISSGGTVNVTLNDVRLDFEKDNRCAFAITNNSTVYLTLQGDNELRSGYNHAGIYVETGSTLIITKESGTAHLKAESASKTHPTREALGAGIGGGYNGTNPNFGTIIIEGGDIEAYSYTSLDEAHANGAGIGGGSGSSVGNIIIKGGKVRAACIDDFGATAASLNKRAVGAGIGGGYSGTVSSIAILGGNVNAWTDGGWYGDAPEIGAGVDGSAPTIILGRWDKNTDEPIITGNPQRGKVCDAKTGHLSTNSSDRDVTLPANLQIYLSEEPVEGYLNAHTMELVKTKDPMEGAHTITVYTKDGGKTPDQIIEQFANLYYGADCTVEVPSNIHCDKGHHFMGWMKAVGTAPAAAIQEPVAGTGTVTIPSGTEDEKLLRYITVGDASGIEKTTYSAVWVDNEMPITVKTGTNWTTNTNVAPKVSVTPAEAVSLLEYTFNDGSNNELNVSQAEVDFVNTNSNVLKGTPTLSGQEVSKMLENVTATVKVKDSSNSGVTVEFKPFVIYAKDLLITSATITPKAKHTYNGKDHNGTEGDEDHLLTVKGKVDGGSETDIVLREGVHYRIIRYTKDGQLGSEDQNNGVKVKDAGVYKDITIMNILDNGVKFDSSVTGTVVIGGDKKEYKISGEVTVEKYTITVKPEEGSWTLDSQKPFKINFAPAQGSIIQETGETVYYTGSLGISKDEGSTVITNTPTEIGNYKVVQNNLELATNGAFDVNNYKLAFISDIAFTVNKDMSKDDSGVTLTVTETKDLTYDGKDHTITVSVKDGNKDLIKDTDYTLSLTGGIGASTENLTVKNAGTYTVTVTGKGLYTGTKTATFTVATAKITKAAAKNQTVTLGKVDTEFKKEATSETVELTGLVNNEKPVFDTNGSSLKLVADASSYTEAKTYTDAIEIEKLALKDADDGSFLAANYDISNLSYNTNESRGDLIVETDDQIDITDPTGDIDFENGKMVYNGKTPNNINLSVFIDGEQLDKSDYTVEYKKNNQTVGNNEKLNVGNYTVTVKISNGSIAQKQLNVTQRPLKVNFVLSNLDESYIGKEIQAADYVSYSLNGANEGLVQGETPTILGTFKIDNQKNVNGKYDVTISKLKISDSQTFSSANYKTVLYVNGTDITVNENGDGTTEIEDPTNTDEGGDGDGDGDIKLFRIYTDEVCAGVELEYSREVVKGGQSTIVTVNVEKGYDASALKLSYKEGMYGDWKPLTLNKDGQYQIKNIWNDIYVRAEGVVTGMEDIDGTARVYAKDGSLYIYTPQQDDIAVISMTGSVVKRTKQVGLQSYPLNQGIYVVRVGEQVFKVRVK